jgi:hypothetical protein
MNEQFTPEFIADERELARNVGLPWRISRNGSPQMGGNNFVRLVTSPPDPWQIADGFSINEAEYASDAANNYLDALSQIEALRAQVAELRADRDSESRWAKEYLARAERAEAEIKQWQERAALELSRNMTNGAGRIIAEQDAERLATVLKDLQMAVAYDLRHGDNENEDKAWDALNKLSDSLSQASTALAAHDAAKDGPP